MARLFWMAVGAGAGMWAARKVKDKAQKYTPEGVADNVTGIGEAIRYFADEVRAGMAEREAELYRAIGADVTAAAAPPVIQAGREYPMLPPARGPYRGRDVYGREVYDPYELDAYDPRDAHDRYENQQGFRLGLPGAAPAPRLHDRRDGGGKYDRKDRR
ncbi:MAG TPA: DUF6167 family protein [Yinghuangia sp.]|uniref:DUF6167 family protein n=1 Tax=Yinghuangia sp. YIM S10712 TaxID=3436930 RepID=UPI002BD9D1DA|nr:DUF6167 family protein [Yinghuangia sp.]